MPLIGKDKARAAAMASIDALEARFAQNIETLCEDIDKHIKALTPVNTGEAVRNYIWTTGTPNSTVYKAIANGPTGPTNSMRLGSEPRRPANEAAAAESLKSLNLKANPFATIYLSNVAQDIVGLELGILPGPPYRSRSPQGMFGITSQHFNILVAAQGILK
jgi:hypothetical protein